MGPLRAVWGLLFRLFPTPVATGLRPVGRPGPESPVLVTCNFDLTVRRVLRAVRGQDLWLLLANSRGVNVWCAAGGEVLTTEAVAAVLKTSGVAERVRHRSAILPPLAAPGVSARELEQLTGWSVRWGPVRAADIPAYLAAGQRSEVQKRVSYTWRERLDTALGTLFPFFLLGAGVVALAAAGLLLTYLLAAAATFLVFMLACPYIPGRRGLTKALVGEALLGAALAATWPAGWGAARPALLVAMGTLLVLGGDLGGLSSTLRSELDPLLARLGVGRMGNVAFAGTVRAELLAGRRTLTIDAAACIGCRSCAEICPQGVWSSGEAEKAVLARPGACTACRACLVQCPSGAIQARRR